MSVKFDFSGKLVLVTGSTKGIGYVTAQMYLKAGAVVVITGRSDETVNAAIDKLVAAGGAKDKLHGVAANVSTAEGCQTVIDKVKQIGPLDVLVNNAGFYNVGEWDSFTDDDWQQYWDVNVMSGIRLSRAFLKQMLERNSGNIVFISSEAGIRTIPQMVPYSVSKSAQLSVARGLAANTKGTNVRVNSVLPGPTLSEGVEVYLDQMTEKAKAEATQKGEDAEKVTKEIVATQYFKNDEPTSLIQRFLKTDEVANAILYISSDAASGINGTSHKVEGGICPSII